MEENKLLTYCKDRLKWKMGRVRELGFIDEDEYRGVIDEIDRESDIEEIRSALDIELYIEMLIYKKKLSNKVIRRRMELARKSRVYTEIEETSLEGYNEDGGLDDAMYGENVNNFFMDDETTNPSETLEGYEEGEEDGDNFFMDNEEKALADYEDDLFADDADDDDFFMDDEEKTLADDTDDELGEDDLFADDDDFFMDDKDSLNESNDCSEDRIQSGIWSKAKEVKKVEYTGRERIFKDREHGSAQDILDKIDSIGSLFKRVIIRGKDS